jgi:hypothetical protein
LLEQGLGALGAVGAIGKQTTQGALGLMKDKVQGARDVAEENIVTKEKMGVFIGMSIGGFVCISLAFSFLPLIVLAPAKFALLFTLGSMLQVQRRICGICFWNVIRKLGCARVSYHSGVLRRAASRVVLFFDVVFPRRYTSPDFRVVGMHARNSRSHGHVSASITCVGLAGQSAVQRLVCNPRSCAHA